MLLKKLKEEETILLFPLGFYRITRTLLQLVKSVYFNSKRRYEMLKKRYEIAPLLKFAKKYGFIELRDELLKTLEK